MADWEYDYCIRAVLIGDATVGKSSLFVRYDEGAFRPGFYNCVPPSFTMKFERFKEFIVRLMVWDTSGSERFGKLPQNIRAFVKKNQKPYKNKDIAIIVFDLSNRETFEHVDYWFSRAKNFAAKETVFALLGNKKDLVREISEEEAREKAEKWAAIYMEVSALTGENINDVFRNTSEEVVWNIRRNYSKITEKF